MAYIKYLGDPVYSKVNNSTAALCASSSASTKPYLTLSDGVFSVVSGGVSVAEFNNFKGMTYPVDGYTVLNLEVCQEETVQLILNDIDSNPLNPSRSYTKGILLFVKYPTLDEDGVETNPADYWVEAEYTVLDNAYAETAAATFSIGESFMHTAPQNSTDSRRLFKSFNIYNPSTKFSVKLSVLLIKTKTDSDPNNCDC